MKRCFDIHLWISFTPNAADVFVDVAIPAEVHFVAKQNSLLKIGNNGNLVLGPFDESTPCLIIFRICTNPLVAKAVRDVIKPVFADLSHKAFLKKCLGEKCGLKINRNVCVSLAERDNRRIFTSRQRRLASSFEARTAKKIKKTKEIELFQEQEGIFYDPGAF
ncbi:hypothetical protein TNCV_3237161 [Trichonephila clavipes]|nr:hypothetical protein TNCV_3237161 [Trichonephila clavipes]